MMNHQTKSLVFLLVWLLLPAVGWGSHFDDVVNSTGHEAALQAAFNEFPFLTPATDDDGKPAFQTVVSDNHTNIDGVDFYGFRFKVPNRKAQEDLVWAFVQTNPSNWYIVPETGDMHGFEKYFYAPKSSYQGSGRLVKGKTLVVQYLSGDSLEDGKTYLIWFAGKKSQTLRISVLLTFAEVGPNKSKHSGYLEKVLGLRRK